MGAIRSAKLSAFPPPISANQAVTVTATANNASANTSAMARTSTKLPSTSNTSSLAAISEIAAATHVARSKCKTAHTPNGDTHSNFATSQRATHNKFLQQQQSQAHQQHLHFSMPLRPALMLAVLGLTLLSCAPQTFSNPVFVDNPSLAQFQSGRNIRHLPCIVRKSGRSGVCMFAIDCIKQNGTHLGTCIDRFYFGSCCQLKTEPSLFAPEISDNSIDQNTISHFVHESTTLPTSTLFKFTTTANPAQHSSASHGISETIRNVTQSYLQQNSVTSPTTMSTAGSNNFTLQFSKLDTTSHKPPSRRPPSNTTHKISQFVVRTTARPATVAPTTIKPPRRKTTVRRPILTTTEREEVPPKPATPIDSTTQPPKFFTFQIVETTTPSPTEPSTLDELVTTQRPLNSTQRYRPKPNNDELLHTETPSGTTPSKSPVKSTTRPKPLVTRRPTTTHKKPSSTHTKRPTTSGGKPSRRPPISSAANETSKPSPATAAVATATASATAGNGSFTTSTTVTAGTTNRRPPVSHDEFSPTTTGSGTKVPQTSRPPTTETASSGTPLTTHAPRPRPKPTGEIVKVPKPTVGAVVTTNRPAPTTTSSKVTTQSTAATTSASTIATAPVTVTKRPSGTHTPTKTKPPTSTSSSSTATTTTSKPKPITTVAPPTLTTEALKVESPLLDQQTTMKPGLITWTNVDAEPTTMNATIEEIWQTPTILADNYNKTTTMETTTQKATSSYGTTSVPTTSTSISVSTSISEIMSNSSSIMPKPERPSSTAAGSKPAKPSKPTQTTERPTTTTGESSTFGSSTSTSTTATTSAPKTDSTTPKTTTTSAPKTDSTTPKTTTTASATTTTPETTIDMESSMTSSESSMEEMSTTGSGIFMTTDYNTEDYNGTISTSTSTPVNTLEGMDYRQICGRRMFPEPRIVGGSNAAFGRWPWQISLRQWRTSTYLHKCGAALLNENWAITAAHCVENVPPSDLLLRMGEYDLAEEEEPYGYQERRVQIVASHPQFDARTFEYDLALLRFYEPVVFQPNIIPVCVPNSDMDFVSQTAFVTGWGRLYENGPLPSVLQEVAVPVINNTICESMYRVAGFIEHIPHIFICAGWKKGGYDSCEGDSGGPMVLQREDDKRFQLGGVISWGIGCAEANQPGVYTRISEFRDWINQILQF